MYVFLVYLVSSFERYDDGGLRYMDGRQWQACHGGWLPLKPRAYAVYGCWFTDVTDQSSSDVRPKLSSLQLMAYVRHFAISQHMRTTTHSDNNEVNKRASLLTNFTF